MHVLLKSRHPFSTIGVGEDYACLFLLKLCKIKSGDHSLKTNKQRTMLTKITGLGIRTGEYSS